MNDFVIDAIRKTLSASGGASSPTRSVPTPPLATSAPSRTSPQAMPGASVRNAQRAKTSASASEGSSMTRQPTGRASHHFLIALSFRISRTAWWPGKPVTPPPAWVADDAWYRPLIGVR